MTNPPTPAPNPANPPANPSKKRGGRRPGAGAPRGNVSAARHGLTARRFPKGCEYVAKLCYAFHGQLTAAVVDLRGEVSIVDAGLVETATHCYRHMALAQKWLAENADLTASEKLKFSAEVARASGERDKVLAALGLNEARNRSTVGGFFDTIADRPLRTLPPAADSPPREAGDATSVLQPGLSPSVGRGLAGDADSQGRADDPQHALGQQ